MEEEQLLVDADGTVIALLRLFDAHVVLLHELFGRERHCIDANERILGDIRAPVRARTWWR